VKEKQDSNCVVLDSKDPKMLCCTAPKVPKVDHNPFDPKIIQKKMKKTLDTESLFVKNESVIGMATPCYNRHAGSHSSWPLVYFETGEPHESAALLLC
jgi:hypothetical protein